MTTDLRAVARWLLVAAIGMLACAAPLSAETCSENVVQLRGDWGEARFTVEIADTAQERSRGLMYRETLPRGSGMLFVYEHPQRTAFWMKNTLIPLDILFFDRQGVLTRIGHDAIPGDLTPIEGGDAVFVALEINAGLARDYGITEGSQMRHPVFSGGPAAWPC